MNELETQSKDIGLFRLSFYPGGAGLSVVRAWRIGAYPSTLRKDPYPSWQIYEGEFYTAFELYNQLNDENEIDKLCDNMGRNPRITRAEELAEFREKYPETQPKK